ncbi:hypothetical protein KQH50_02850 [bacterium]|nr:hypothetical protein [bacterium]
MRPADKVFTGIYETADDERSAFGQVYQSPKINSAQIHFLMAPDGAERDLGPLLEGLVKEAGAWGAKQVVAEVSPDSDVYPQLRQAGFFVYAKQRLFELDSGSLASSGLEQHWRIWNSDDIPAMRMLYQALVPALMRSLEPITRLEKLGLVYYDDAGDLQAFADLVYGPVGVWALPFVNPQSSVDMAGMLVQLVRDMQDLGGRPVYLAARSYQPWIENALESLGIERSPEQALVAKYLTVRQPERAELAFQHLRNGNTEPTFPVTTIKSDPNN